MKTFRILLAAMAAFFVPAILSAQSSTSITAKNLGVESGQLCFTQTDTNDNVIGDPLCGDIEHGVLKASLLVPSAASYRLTVVNDKQVSLTIRNVPVLGDAWDFESYILPADGMALGYGTPKMLCSVGARFVSTDQQPSNWVCALNGTTTTWQAYPSRSYCPVNSAYVTPSEGPGFCVAFQSSGRGTPSGACTNNSLYFQQDAGAPFLWACVNGVWTHLESSTGTVSSIGIDVPAQMTVSGSPIVDKGTITLGLNTTGSGTRVATATNNGIPGNCVNWDGNGNVADGGGPCVTFQIEPANTAFMAPNGVDGLPSFRHITTLDLPFSYSGSTTELATVSGTLISGQVPEVGANGNLSNATSSTYFPGYLNATQVKGLAPSATIDTTNADNITSGTLNANRLPASLFTCPTGTVISGFTLNDNAHPVCSTAGGTVNVGNVGALPFYSESPEGATVSPDSVARTDGAGNLVAKSLQLNTAGSGALTISSLGGVDTGCLFADKGGTIHSTGYGCGVNGTVSSIGIAVPDIFNVANTPVTSSGVITIGVNAQPSRTFWRGPISGNPATPGFGNIALTDLPDSPLQDFGGVILAGPVTRDFETPPFGYYSPRWRNVVATDFGKNIAPHALLIGPTSGDPTNLPSFRALETSDLPTTIVNGTPTLCPAGYAAKGIDAQGNATGCFIVSGGSVTSVGLSMPSIFSVSGSPVTVAGTLSATLVSQSGGLVFASPAGASGTPFFRSLAASDLPASFNAPTATKLATTPSACTGGLVATGVDAYGNAICGSAGSVTSVGLSAPSDLFSVSNSPITTNGSLTFAAVAQGIHKFWAGPYTGGVNATAVPSFRVIDTSDLPNTIFKSAPAVCTGGAFSTGIDATGNAICANAGGVTSVGLSMPSIFSVSSSPVVGAGTLTATLNSQSANLVFASPSGSAGAPVFRSLTAADIPTGIIPTQITLQGTGNCASSLPSGISDPLSKWQCINTGNDTYVSGFSLFANPSRNGNNVMNSVSGLHFFNNHGSGTGVTGGIEAVSSAPSTGLSADNIHILSGGNVAGIIPSSGGFVGSNTGVIGFQAAAASSTAANGSATSAISSCGSDCLAVGNGTQSDSSGTIKVSKIDFGSAGGFLAPNLTDGTLEVNLPDNVSLTIKGGVRVTGATIVGSTLSIASTTNLNTTYFNNTAIVNSLNTANATSGNYSSNTLQFKGSYWDGTQANDTVWSLQNKVGTGQTPTQTLTFVASGSPGVASIEVPGLKIGSLDGCLQAVSGTVISTGIPCGSGGSGGGSGTVTYMTASNLSPLFTTTIDTPTTTPALNFALSDAPAHTFLGNTGSGGAQPSYSAITVADLPVLTSAKLPTDVAYTDASNTFSVSQTFSQNVTVGGDLTASTLTAGRCLQTTTGGKLTVTGTACQQGTVTSVGVTVPSQMTVTGSPITTTGTIALGLNTLGAGSKLATASAVGASGHVVTWTSSGDLGDGGSLPVINSGTSGYLSYYSSASGLSNTYNTYLNGSMAHGVGYYESPSSPYPVGIAITGLGSYSTEASYWYSTYGGNTYLTAPNGNLYLQPKAGLQAYLGSYWNFTNTSPLAGCLSTAAGGAVSSIGVPCVENVAVAPNTFYRGPSSGTTSANPSFGALVTADMPTNVFKSVPVSCSSGYMVGVGVNGNAICNNSGYIINTLTATTNPDWITVGDFNGDGLQDVAVSNWNANNTIQIFLNAGNGSFYLNGLYASTVYGQGIASGDLNGDGKLDLVTVVSNNSSAGWYGVLLGNGDGTFQTPVFTSTGINPMGIILKDVTGDGKLDLLFASLNNNTFYVYSGTGSGTFSLLHSYSLASGFSPAAMAIGDFNKDGKQDLAITSWGAGGSGISLAIYNGDGLGGFSLFNTITLPGTQNHAISAGDFNGDGNIDIAVLSASTKSLYVYLNNGSESFTLNQTVNNQNTTDLGHGVFQMPVADINGDGYSDMIIPSSTNGNINILYGTSLGNLILNKTVTTGSGASAAAIANFTSTDSNSIVVVNDTAGTVSFLYNQAPASSQNPLYWVSTNTNQSVTGQKSFGPTQIFNSGISIHNKNYGDNWNITSSSPSTGNGTFAAPLSYASGSNTTSIVSADFNGDGYADYAASNATSNSISVYVNNGNGTFAPAVSYATGTAPWRMTSGDFNGDGYPDIATANGTSNNVSVFINNGNGTFANAVNYASGLSDGTAAIAAGDFNNDGKIDLIVGSGTVNTRIPTILPGNGNGTFGTPVSLTAVGSFGAAFQMYPIDLNGDGYLDVVFSSNYSGSTMSSYSLNNGSGVISSSVLGAQNTLSLGTPSYGIVAGDVNGDGKPDIVVATSATNNVRVFLNNGNGTFATGVAYSAGTSPFGIDLIDTNGDGALDIVVTNNSPGTISVLLNSGTGTFGAPTSFSAVSSSFFLTHGDFNRDGIQDVAISSNTAGNTVVLQGLGPSSTTNILSLDHTAGVANGAVQVPALMLKSQQTPATSSDTCLANTMVFDSNYIYICTAANTWKRTSLSTF